MVLVLVHAKEGKNNNTRFVCTVD